MELLATQKGYQLVGTSISGVNAFFVRKDIANNLFALPATAENLYNPCRFNSMHFVSGHPAKECLLNVYSRKDRMNARFEQTQEDGFVAAHGFHPKECIESKFIIQWMSEQEARLYARADGECRQIVIQYVYGLPEGECSLAAFVENQKILSDVPVMPSGELVIPVKEVDCGLVCFDIEISKLWQPSEVIGTPDTRNLGIGIQKVTAE